MASQPSIEQRAAIERACEQLCIAYARAIDFRDYDEFVMLFTHDGELTLGETFAGRRAIASYLAGRPDGMLARHVISNVFVDVVDADRARGIAYLTLYRHTGDEGDSRPIDFGGPAAVGHYEDVYVRTMEDGAEEPRWRFRRRRLHLAFRNRELI